MTYSTRFQRKIDSGLFEAKQKLIDIDEEIGFLRKLDSNYFFNHKYCEKKPEAIKQRIKELGNNRFTALQNLGEAEKKYKQSSLFYRLKWAFFPNRNFVVNTKD